MITSVVVDTDVVSFIFKQDTRAALYQSHLASKLQVISFTTVAELHQWAKIYNWGKPKQERLEKYLRSFVIFYSDYTLCLKGAAVRNSARKRGRPIQPADAWIAATALLHDIPLVTHNSKDYAGVDELTILSEANP
ncbi:MAG: PIN domain-containing protein [Acidobacteria bacterium]|nr:PIN domain-containing protein [Acidobacteriota bacterium]